MRQDDRISYSDLDKSLQTPRTVPHRYYKPRDLRTAGALSTLFTIVVAGCASDGQGRAGGDPFAGLDAIAEEELRIGSVDDPELAFTWFRSLDVADDGRIYTGHLQESQIRVHSASGELVRTIGSAGEGPGQFDDVGPITILRDTLWVFDYGLYRLTAFDLDGNVLSTRRIDIDLGTSMTDLPARPNRMLSDGTLVGSPPAWSRLVASGDITSSMLVRMDTLGATIDTIGSYSLVNTVWEITDAGDGEFSFGSYRQQPFSDAEILTVSMYHPVAVRVGRRYEPSDSGASFHVTAWEFDGDTLFDRSYSYTPIPLRVEIVDSIIDSFARSVSESDRFGGSVSHEQASEWARSGLYLPEVHPAVSALVIGERGNFWLRAEEMGEPATLWRVLDPSGEPLATVELPSGFRMLHADGMTVWGSEHDELDVPYIVRYRINTGRS